MKSKLLALAVLIPIATVLARETAPPINGDLDLAHRLETAFEKVAAQASESVVVISAKHKIIARSESDGDDDDMEQFKGTPFEYFFRQHRFRIPPIPRDEENQGSGVIIR